MLNVQVFDATIASAAASSTTIYVGAYKKLALYVPDMDAWNAGTGNSVINVYGAYNSALTALDIATVNNTGVISGVAITTHAVDNKIYSFDQVCGIPYLKIALNTACTSTANIKILAMK